MQIKTVTLLLVLFSLFTACARNGEPVEVVSGSGNVVTEERSVSGFTAVGLRGAGHLIIDESGKESLSITTDDNLLPYIETSIQGDELVISIQDGVVFTDVSELTYNVSAANLNKVALEGGGKVEIANLDEDELQVTLSGAGEVEAAGNVEKQTVQISGAGAYNASDLASRDATVRHDGAGIAVIQVSENLDVTINGLGSVEYIGNPSVSEEINGLGTVRKR
ncbi:MAG: GIN domain-containing protein [Candidatus Promineifilaceae bacterium]